MFKNKILPLITITSLLTLTLSGCNSANNQSVLSSLTSGTKAPNAYETYKQQGLRVPYNNSAILKPNVRNNYLIQLNDIQQKVIKAILLDQSKNIQEQIEPEKIVYLNSDNVDPTNKDNKFIKDNSTKEDDILFDDSTLFADSKAQKTTVVVKDAKSKVNPQTLTSTASILDDVNTDEISNPNFINAFKDYILYDEVTKTYTQDLLKLHITTNNINRLQFFRLLDTEAKPIDKSNEYLLYDLGVMKTTPTEYILDVKSEQDRIKKLTATNQKITGDQAPMYQIGDNNTTFIGGYLNKIGLHSKTSKELKNYHPHHHNPHQFRYKKK